MTKPKYKIRKKPDPPPEKLVSPPDHCPNWRDEDQLRHGCLSHPEEDVCLCPCGARNDRRERFVEATPTDLT